jgi:kynureninase
LLGAGATEVIIADSTSVNIFKLLSGALALPDVKARRVIVSERGNFPTDLYIAEGVNAMLGGKYNVKLVDAADVEGALDDSVAVALLTQVDYCSGRQHDIARLNERARQTGTHIIWDLSHSAGAIPLELSADGVEMAVGCGYKYLNGGPGAPAFLYLASGLQASFGTPLSGWFGHQAPFAFSTAYVPAPGVERLLCGTPPVIALAALECGIDTFDGVALSAIREKSLALSEIFLAMMNQECKEYGFESVSPADKCLRGSHLSFAHEHAYPIMQALIDRGVIGDFRPPNLLRFGFAPLYVRFADCFDAVIALRDVMENGEWRSTKYQRRNRVT